MTRPVALVTGGAKRVGRAIAETLSRGGFDVAITYHTSAQDAQSFNLSPPRGGTEGGVQESPKRLVIHADFATTTDIPRIASDIQSHFGRLDLLVNSAALYVPDDHPLSHLHDAINFQSPMALTKALTALLRASRGSVVNFLDIFADRPLRHYLKYCASKSALQSGTIELARQLAPDVRVNGIAPGVIDWPDDFPESEKQKYLQNVPLARAGTPQEAADLVLFLATKGTYITGQVIRIDGGRSINW